MIEFEEQNRVINDLILLNNHYLNLINCIDERNFEIEEWKFLDYLDKNKNFISQNLNLKSYNIKEAYLVCFKYILESSYLNFVKYLAFMYSKKELKNMKKNGKNNFFNVLDKEFIEITKIIKVRKKTTDEKIRLIKEKDIEFNNYLSSSNNKKEIEKIKKVDSLNNKNSFLNKIKLVGFTGVLLFNLIGCASLNVKNVNSYENFENNKTRIVSQEQSSIYNVEKREFSDYAILIIDSSFNHNEILNMREVLKKGIELGVKIIDINLDFGNKNAMYERENSTTYKDLLENVKIDRGFVKPFDSAFRGTNLDNYLKSNKIKNLIVMGQQENVCVLKTIIDATQNGYNIYTSMDLIQGLEIDKDTIKQFSQKTLDNQKFITKVKLKNVIKNKGNLCKNYEQLPIFKYENKNENNNKLFAMFKKNRY